MTDYLQHGGRHSYYGTDKTLHDLPIASIRHSSAVSVTADNAFHYVSMQDGIDAHFGTSHPGIFANAQAGSLTGTPYGLQVKKPGTYEVKFVCEIIGGTAGVFATSVLSGTGGALSFYQSGRTGCLLKDGWNGGTSQTELFAESRYVISTSTAQILVPNSKIASGTDPDEQWAIVITRLSPYPDTALF